MLEEYNKKDKEHLINLINMRSNRTPNFALLIGAGASASSGVKISSMMIDEWRRQLYEESKSKEPFDVWKEKQNWYEDDEEYSILFEKICDQRSQRRIYIEECVKDARPSWGYIYLSNIIAQNYFNVVFTPNFDDLANEACFLYADLRPIVCAHDSAVADIRLTSTRPKIIKLHGDFLYDSIKNTIKETETLEKNMRDKFMQFATEYGLIVIGYGGNDRSIMDILDTILKTEGYLPNALYWCRRKNDKVSKRLERLIHRGNTYWIEIEGFDEFMCELHQGLGLELPDTVRDPYKATTERLNSFILPKNEINHPIIKEHIAKLEKQIKKFKQVISEGESGKEFDRLVPYRFLGDREYDRHNYKDAIIYYEKGLIQDPDNRRMLPRVILSYIATENFDKALMMSEKMIKQDPNDYRGYYYKGTALTHLNKLEDAVAIFRDSLKYTAKDAEARNLVFISISNTLLIVGKWQDAFDNAENALKINPPGYAALINKCVALKKLGKENEARQILKIALPRFKEHPYHRACLYAVLANKENMLNALEKAIKEDSMYRVTAKLDPDFVDYREDPDFQKLVYGQQNVEE